MSFIFNLTIEPTHVIAEFSGNAQANDIVQAYQHIIDAAKEHKVDKLLINLEQLTLDYPSSDILYVMKNISSQLTPFKTARIVAKEGLKQLLIAQMAENNALNLKNFNSETAALDWLLNIN